MNRKELDTLEIGDKIHFVFWYDAYMPHFTSGTVFAIMRDGLLLVAHGKKEYRVMYYEVTHINGKSCIWETKFTHTEE